MDGPLRGQIGGSVESTGWTLATRLYEATDDPGMQDILAYPFARYTMHQNQ